MITYQEFEKTVYDWLMKKHEKDNSFTFSVRQKANSGSRSDYFIGSKKSNYFGTTLVTVPVGFPGSSTDLNDIIFRRLGDKFGYYIEFTQTRNPHDAQNTSALNLIQNIKERIRAVNGFDYESKPSNKMETYRTKPAQKEYITVEDLLVDLEKDLVQIIPIIEHGIHEEKIKNPEFIAHRITPEEFDKMQEKLKKRQKKYGEESGDGPPGDPPHKDAEVRTTIESPPLNQILFGPPGTGKTYHTVNKALEILGVETKNKTRTEIKESFDNALINDWEKADGQIAFITFHQSMSYEDFIEGIKPQDPEENNKENVVYKIEDGIFKKLCIEAAFDIAIQNKTGETEKLLDFSSAYDALLEEIDAKLSEGVKVELTTKNRGKIIVTDISQQGNVIVEHIGGTRTYTVSKSRLTKLSSAIDSLDDISNINDHFRAIIGGSNSSAYWAVLNAIRSKYKTTIKISDPKKYTLDEKKNIVIESKKEIYKDRVGKPYILIIDEINRGNVSQIFGELITLIEKDKRLGQDEDLETILPYSKKKFGVPPNLFIIGTMNTADRSVEALDSALRRRFSFEEMAPIPDLVAPERQLWNLLWEYKDIPWENKDFLAIENNLIRLIDVDNNYEKEKNDLWDKFEKEGRAESQIIELKENFNFQLRLDDILKTINNRIEKLLDKDHLIGHSYFMKVKSIKDLMDAFYNEIIPLLQEYFYGDFGKIGLVLGKGFIRRKDFQLEKKQKLFADFDYETQGLDERDVFEVMDYRNETLKYTIEERILVEETEDQTPKPTTEERMLNFEDAMKILMK